MIVWGAYVVGKNTFEVYGGLVFSLSKVYGVCFLLLHGIFKRKVTLSHCAQSVELEQSHPYS